MRSRSPRGKPGTIDDLLASLQPDVRDALVEASAYLREKGVAHAVIGGVAVAAHGYVINTVDVDFLVRDASFFQGRSRLIALSPGPTEFRGKTLDVRIDYLSGRTYPNLPRLEDEVEGEESPHVVALFPLLYMKLTAWRPKDQGHVIGLLNAGSVDIAGFRTWLRTEARDAARIEARLDRVLKQANAER